eukprot:SAG11_NODE_26_length_23420_cov_40.459886_25_plen_73_part_00
MLLQLGCLPFVAAPLALLGGGLPTPVGVISELALGRALLTYGAIILSFIGGLHQVGEMHWGALVFGDLIPNF